MMNFDCIRRGIGRHAVRLYRRVQWQQIAHQCEVYSQHFHVCRSTTFLKRSRVMCMALARQEKSDVDFYKVRNWWRIVV